MLIYIYIYGIYGYIYTACIDLTMIRCWTEPRILYFFLDSNDKFSSPVRPSMSYFEHMQSVHADQTLHYPAFDQDLGYSIETGK